MSELGVPLQKPVVMLLFTEWDKHYLVSNLNPSILSMNVAPPSTCKTRRKATYVNADQPHPDPKPPKKTDQHNSYSQSTDREDAKH
ncbi:hypothetical protein HYALB_00011294 [Hymenoscyphus albidus]|uniref:Uncharacterized protein n=1 Tax=Hymenoscyphus albidus TaxID=595503 RepID=A0A9N9LKT7_9HELO|nr:hypothetical protein HYALB_00011294 [Hymenoscyphus albidus]